MSTLTYDKLIIFNKKFDSPLKYRHAESAVSTLIELRIILAATVIPRSHTRPLFEGSEEG